MGKERHKLDRVVSTSKLQDLLEGRAAGLQTYVRRKIPSGMKGSLAPEDILQEVWIACFCGVATFRENEPDAFDRWLRTITDRKLVDAIRWGKRLKRGARVRFDGTAQQRQTSLVDLFARVAAKQRTPSSEEGAREASVAMKVS